VGKLHTRSAERRRPLTIPFLETESEERVADVYVSDAEIATSLFSDVGGTERG
jgi:hypothetical protein